jgi:hypothetical protein
VSSSDIVGQEQLTLPSIWPAEKISVRPVTLDRIRGRSVPSLFKPQIPTDQLAPPKGTHLAKERLGEPHRTDWETAYTQSGRGSGLRRAGEIRRIYEESARPSVRQ